MPAFGKHVAYQGYTLKSRHEFAWAQYFEAEGFDWEYEPETFKGDGRRYTPDFRLAGAIFIEIKADRARNLDNHFDLCNKPLLLIFGEPYARPYIRLKPAGAPAFLPDRLKTFAEAYALAQRSE